MPEPSRLQPYAVLPLPRPFVVSLRDTYRPNTMLSVESLAYVNELGYEPGDSGSVASLDTRTAQLTSFATWRPADRSPLYVTGSLRALGVQSDSGASASESQSYDATLGANYQASPFTRLFGTLAVTENRSTSASALTTTQSAGVSYTPALIPLGPYSFSWSASANLANRSVSGEGSQQAISGSIGHNLQRGFDTSATSRTNLNFAQTLATVYDTDFGDRYTLTNSFNLSWSSAGTPGSAQFASLTLSDSRSWGQVSNDFQLVNLQLTRQSILNRVSSWSGNVTVQGSRQHTESTPEPGLPASLFPSTQTQSLSPQPPSYLSPPAYRQAGSWGRARVGGPLWSTEEDSDGDGESFFDLLFPGSRSFLISRIVSPLSLSPTATM